MVLFLLIIKIIWAHIELEFLIMKKVKIIFERSDFRIEYEDMRLSEDGASIEDEENKDEGGFLSWFD
jgi:hypothetical protein